MNTSSSADQRQGGRSSEPPPGVDVTRTGASRDGQPAGLPSDAELSALANHLYAAGPGGTRVPTTASHTGTGGGAPQGRDQRHPDSATAFGVAEERRVHSLLQPQSAGAPLNSGTAAHGSGGSAGGYGRSLPATSVTGGPPPFGREGFTPNVPSQAQTAESTLFGSTASPMGLEPGRSRTLGQPHAALPQSYTPSAPSGTLPSPNSGPQMPGHSRGGFGRPIPSTPDGVMAHSVPGAALSSQAGGPPVVGGPAAATPLAAPLGSHFGASPLAATPLNFAPPTNFTQLEDERIRTLLPPCLRPDPVLSSHGGVGSTDFAPGDGRASPFYFLRETATATGVTSKLPAGPAMAPYRSSGGASSGHRVFDIRAIRADFPILNETINGKRLVWFDNAATTQKPHAVIQRLVDFYQHENSNIHRAAHELAARATDAYEDARETVARFINAPSPREIVFVRGTTEGINLVAQSWGRQNVREGDEIVLTNLEHHANIVPWQFLAQETGARILVAPVDDSGQIRLDEFQRLMSRRTRIVAFPQVSNALGTVTPAGEMIDIAHRYGAKVLVDAAQSIAHMPGDVKQLDADWFVFSGHKVFGPTGIGVVYGKQDLLNATLPWQGGGNMIERVTFEQSTFQPAPNRFEAGTGNIADAVGLGAALQYLEALGMDNVNRYEHELLHYAMDAMRSVNGLSLIGTARDKASVLSFVLAGHDNEEVGKALNGEGIAVRAGHHCAQPILRRFGLETSVRPSLALYNTHDEVDHLVAALHHIKGGGPK